MPVGCNSSQTKSYLQTGPISKCKSDVEIVLQGPSSESSLAQNACWMYYWYHLTLFCMGSVTMLFCIGSGGWKSPPHHIHVFGLEQSILHQSCSKFNFMKLLFSILFDQIIISHTKSKQKKNRTNKPERTNHNANQNDRIRTNNSDRNTSERTT